MKLRKTATETSSLSCEVCGREVKSYFKYSHEMALENAKGHERSVWKCVQLPMEIRLKAIALTK